MRILIRDADPEDAEIMFDAERYWATLPGHLVSRPEELKLESFESRIKSLSADPKGLYIVAENEEDEVIGHAMLDPMGLGSIAHIVRLTIVVHAGFENRGVGALLMEHLIEWAKKIAGVEKIELLVRAQNQRAISLYKKFGFFEEGRHKNRIKLSEGKYVDDIAMGLMVK